MYRLFYWCAAALVLFEIVNWVLLVPLPFRENLINLNLSYFLYNYRLIIRAELWIGIIFGVISAYRRKSQTTLIVSAALVAIIYFCNFKFTAAKMYRRASPKVMISGSCNKENLDMLIVGVVKNCEARAYPLKYLTYHHRVIDGMCGKRFMITFCPITRTIKVYLTDRNGKNEYYHYLGISGHDQIYEDFQTGTWWSQSTGLAIAGKRKGESLIEWPTHVTTLREWLKYNPESMVMQADERYKDQYNKYETFEFGSAFEGYAISARTLEESGLKISDHYKISADEENRIRSKSIHSKTTSSKY